VAHYWEWVEAPVVPQAVWDEAQGLQDRQTILEMTIDGYNRGGLVAHWKKIECFIPASHLISYPFPADPMMREQQFEEYLGEALHLCVIEVEPVRNRILLSERQAVAVVDGDLQEPSWPDWLCADTVCEGIVTSIRPFGAFVDIGPLEGMIHISEISWGRVRHPQDFLEPGQSVKVLILSVDLDNQRVALSLKRLQPNPWDTVEERLKPGDLVSGTVVGVERFGVFVELVDGIEGLLHISELEASMDQSRQRYGGNVEGRSDVGLDKLYHVGQPVSVYVLDIMPEDHRIALGLAEGKHTHVSA
jgi:small subunit ribosomal protein S1